MNDKEFTDNIIELIIDNKNIPILPTGSRLDVLVVIYIHILQQVQKHPIIWKLFFKIY